MLELPPVKKNQRGYSTDAKVLTELSAIHPLPDLVLRYREFSKIKNTYIDALPRMRAADGRVHTQFNETVTTTGRLSSSDPNLQNIPVRTEFGRQIRSCFVPLRAGELFLSADYSQIELRLLAHLSGDERSVAAFNSGADFHASTASRVFGLPVEAVTPELRSRAKAVNFGIVYGQQAFGLSQTLDIPVAEAREMIDRYFEAYPGVRTYLDETVAEARERGFAETMLGRKRHIPELKSSNGQQRGLRRAHGHEPPHAGQRRRHHQDGHERGAAPSSGRGLRGPAHDPGARRAGLLGAGWGSGAAGRHGERGHGRCRQPEGAPHRRRQLGPHLGRSALAAFAGG